MIIFSARQKLYFLGSGIALGALSWGLVSLVSNRFEPFDSGIGFIVNQAVLSFAAFGISFGFGTSASLIVLLGAYSGMNAYAYILGGSETRAWVTLGLITALGLLVIPAIFGVLGRLLSLAISRFRSLKKLP